MERLSDFWSACAQLRSQLTFLGIKYPLSVEAVTDDQGQEFLKATATIMLPRIKGKTFISYILDKDTYTRWPLSVRGLKVDAKVAYGDVQYVTNPSTLLRSSFSASETKSSCEGLSRLYLVSHLRELLVVSWMLASTLHNNLSSIWIRIYTLCTLYDELERKGGCVIREWCAIQKNHDRA